MNKEERLALKKAEYESKVFPTKTCGNILVLEYISSTNITIKFINTGNIRKTRTSDIRKKEIRDNEAFPVYKVGTMDIPNELQKGKPNPREYSIWNGIRQRCYNENLRDRLMSYKDVEMSENFKIYSYFKDWCHKQVGFNEEGWQLDKDILSKDNKVYSEDTCCFVPPEINCAVTNNKTVRGQFPQGVIYNCTKTRYRARIQRSNKWESLGTYDTPEEAFYAYKPVKEAHMKSLAEKWKNQIDPRVYEALMNWEVNIDD
jgi:hypothetical protein